VRIDEKVREKMRASSHRAASFRKIITDFVRDEYGAVQISELILIATILAIGSIVGLSSYQNAVVTEYNDLGLAIGSLNQSFSYALPSGAVVGYSDTEPDPTDVSVSQSGPMAEQ